MNNLQQLIEVIKEEKLVAENADEPNNNGLDCKIIRSDLNMILIPGERSSTRTENKSVNSGYKDHRVHIKISPERGRESFDGKIKDSPAKVTKRTFPLK